MKILVLGSQGMLGRAVFRYLSQKYPWVVWGTSRTQIIEKKTLFFDAQIPSKLPNLLKKIGNVDYIINCIGILRSGPPEEMKTINTDFPNELARVAKKNKGKIIHISTDAVFSSLAGIVTERDKPNPDDSYGMSKLLGEVHANNFLSIRTSLLGFSPIQHTGLLDWVIQTQNIPIPGFRNQLWSGCTVLQCAMLCKKIISRDTFDNLRKKSHVLHFFPIRPITKYQLIKDFLTIMQLKKSVKKSYGSEVTRILKSNFEKELYLNEFASSHTDALKELMEFERMTV